MERPDCFPIGSLERAVADAVLHHRGWMDGAAILEYDDDTFDAVPGVVLTDMSWVLRGRVRRVLYRLRDLANWWGPEYGIDTEHLDAETVRWLADTLREDSGEPAQDEDDDIAGRIVSKWTALPPPFQRAIEVLLDALLEAQGTRTDIGQLIAQCDEGRVSRARRRNA